MTDLLLTPTFLAALDRLALVSRRLRAGAYKGERRSPRRGGSVEFADFREYAPGDDFRQIDWNAYARLEKLFLRLFVEEEDATVHVLLDASQSMAWGEPRKWESAQRVAAALGYIALVGLDRLSAATLGAHSVLRPLRGKKNALAFFTWLAERQPAGQATPAITLRQYAARARRAGPLIVISDLMDDGWREGILELATQHYEVTVVHLVAPQELVPAFEGDLKLVDSETAAAIEITADYDLLARYRARAQTWQAEWQHFCAARAINYVGVTTATPFQDLVLSILRQRGILH